MFKCSPFTELSNIIIVERVSHMENTTVLCLRGGGADAKRREARKRKFAHLQHSFPPKKLQGGTDVVGMARSVDEKEDDPMTKVSKGRGFDPSVTRPKESPSRSTESEIEEKMDAGTLKDGSQAKSTKSQRFICFVG